MLSNPTLTDTLSNFPLFSSRAGSSRGPEPVEENEPQEGTDAEAQAPGQSLATSPTSDRTARRRGRPRGGPTGRGRRSTSSSSRTTFRANRQLHEQEDVVESEPNLEP